MHGLHLKFAAAALAAGIGALAGQPSAEAAAPKCKPSVGTSNRYVCTTDMTAQPRAPQRNGVAARHQLKPLKFKARTIPCYQSPVPGCS
jgi:hypothetical protein